MDSLDNREVFLRSSDGKKALVREGKPDERTGNSLHFLRNEAVLKHVPFLQENFVYVLPLLAECVDKGEGETVLWIELHPTARFLGNSFL